MSMGDHSTGVHGVGDLALMVSALPSSAYHSKRQEATPGEYPDNICRPLTHLRLRLNLQHLFFPAKFLVERVVIQYRDCELAYRLFVCLFVCLFCSFVGSLLVTLRV